MNAALLGFLASAACGAGVDIRVGADLTLDVDVRGAAVSSVLECLSERAGFKMVIEPGAATQKPVKLSLVGRTPTQAVIAILDGLPLNYAYTTDRTGSKVILLMISGRTDRASAAETQTGTAPAVQPGTRPGSRPKPPVVPAESEPEFVPEPPKIPETLPENVPANPAGLVPFYPEAHPISPLTLRDSGQIHVASRPSKTTRGFTKSDPGPRD